MEDQCSPLSWDCYHQEEGIEDLKHCLLYTTLELETTIQSAQQEIARKEDELIYIKDLLSKTIKERDEAKAKCKRLEAATLSGNTGNEDELRGANESNNGSSSSDSSTVNIIVSPVTELTEKLASKKPVPEKGKFLQAVMEAGPLLQTLLLAGPLPRWQHPPPPLNSIEIPPVIVPSPTPMLLHHE